MHREIEKKFTVELPFESVRGILEKIFPHRAMKQGASTDYYFKANGAFDFVRGRAEGGFSTVCGKKKDRGTNEDRLESEFQTPEPREAVAFIRRALGPEVAVVAKRYAEFVLGESVVSCATTSLNDSILIEVEDPSRENVKLYVQWIKEWIPGMREEARSVFEIATGKSL